MQTMNSWFFRGGTLLAILVLVFVWQGIAQSNAPRKTAHQASNQQPMFREPTLPNPDVKIKTSGFSDADYTAHIERLKRKLPHAGFTIVIQKPFIVVGDEAPQVVQSRAQRTVAWAVRLLKKDYFAKDPNEIIEIWLFKDKASYEKHDVELFGEVPSTPFGFYSSRNKS